MQNIMTKPQPSSLPTQWISFSAKDIFTGLAAIILLVGLYAGSLYNYLLFHSLAEGFAIVIAWGIFMVGWNSREFIDNQYLLFIGIAYLFIGVLDLAHTFSYKGMNILPGYGANAPTQLWIAARYLESLTLLAAPLMLRRKIRVEFYFLGYTALVALLLVSIFILRIFPDCYLESAGGLTPFKIASEYIICLILLVSSLLVVLNRSRFDRKVLQWLLVSITLTVFSELSFTTYSSVYGFSNLLGHYFKIASFYFIYKALVQTGLAKPYDLLFRDLNQQRNWLHVTLSSIGDAVIASDRNGWVTFLNPVASALTAWTPEQAIGQPIQNVLRTVNERTGEPAENIVAKVLEQGCAVNLANHTALIDRHGRQIPIEDSAAPIRDGSGLIIGVVIVFHDVTERRMIHKKLRQSELQYGELVQNTNSAIIRWKSDGTITFFNEYAQKFFGYSAGDVIGRNIGIIVPHTESSGTDLTRLVQDIVDHPEPYTSNTNENICSDGRRVWMTWTNKPIFDENNLVTEIMAIGSDVTELKKAEEALWRSTNKFKLLSATAGRLLSSDAPQNELDRICTEVMEFLDCQAFFNYLADERSGRLCLNAYAGIPESELHNLQVLEYGTAVCGCVARDRERIIAEDIFNSHDVRTELVKGYGIQAYCCHPLLIGDRLIGTLSFGTRTRTHFTEEEVELMRTVADQVTMAIQRIQVQQDLQKINSELEEKVHERTAELERQYRQLRLANEQLNIRAGQLRALAGELTMAEQRERRRMSKVLHDGLQQHLAAAKLQVGGMIGQLANEYLKQSAAAVENILAESLQMTRSLSAELSPPALHEGGLSKGFKWLARWMQEKHHFSVDLSIGTNCKLPEDINVLVFESVRELLFNAVKHASVSRAELSLQQIDEGWIRVTVRDQGIGFDPDRLHPGKDTSGGFGLFSIRERIDYIGGRLEIQSYPGKGSCFSMTVPSCWPAGPGRPNTGRSPQSATHARRFARR